MPRHIVKPFAVEIRRGGRTVKSSTAATCSITDLICEAEQLRVKAWPGVDQAPQPRASEQPSAAIVPAGRVLPALDYPARPADAVEIEEQPALLGRRHWPAVPGLTIESSWPEDDGSAEELAMVTGQVGSEPKEPDVEAEEPAAAPIADARTIAATMLLRRGRSRLPRGAFRREERWKARLPTLMQRAR